jgi:predicted nucleic acid-binding protein
MIKYLLDTNILIYWTKNKPSIVENIVSHGTQALTL